MQKEKTLSQGHFRAYFQNMEKAPTTQYLYCPGMNYDVQYTFALRLSKKALLLSLCEDVIKAELSHLIAKRIVDVMLRRENCWDQHEVSCYAEAIEECGFRSQSDETLKSTPEESCREKVEDVLSGCCSRNMRRKFRSESTLRAEPYTQYSLLPPPDNKLIFYRF